MSKFRISIYVFFSLLLLMPIQADAAENTKSYEFILTVNEEQSVRADAGDLLTVVFTLKKNGQEETSMIRAMQNEIRYDPEYFEILEDSIFTIDGIETKDLELTDGDHAFYINFLSYGEGTEWKNETRVASFQVKVLGESGGAYLKNENCKVSLSNASETAEVSAKDLLVIVSDDGTIESNPNAADADFTDETAKGEASEFPWWILLVIFYAAIIGFAVYLVIRRKKHDI